MNAINDLRKKTGLSQKEFAGLFNVHQTAVSQWETGKTTPDKETLIKIADYFGVSIDYLLGNTEQKEKASIPKDEREITLDDFTFAIFSHKKQPAGYHIRRAFFYFTIFCALLIISRIPSFNSSISFNCDSYKAF